MPRRLLYDGLIAAAFAAAYLVAPGIDSARADDAQVTIVEPGGSRRTLSLAALSGSEDVVERPYALRAAGGESSQTVTGFSSAAILTAADVDPYGFSYLEVQRPEGGSVMLSRDQALDPAAFPEGPPVIYATASGTGFLRPGSAPEDLNAGDSFEAPQGITLVLRNGSPLVVSIDASTVRTRTGRSVSFRAAVERAGSGEQLSYSWYFDDGHWASGPSARHSFAKRGSYDVVVGVTTPGDRAGASAVVTIQVGAPLSGPDRKGGGRNRNAGAPDHGAATGTRGAAPRGPASAPPSQSTPVPTHEPSTPQRSEAHRDRPPRKAEQGQEVSGVLLSDTAERAPKPTPSPEARSGSLSSESAGGGLPGAALGLLVTASLFGGGVLFEVRR